MCVERKENTTPLGDSIKSSLKCNQATLSVIKLPYVCNALYWDTQLQQSLAGGCLRCDHLRTRRRHGTRGLLPPPLCYGELRGEEVWNPEKAQQTSDGAVIGDNKTNTQQRV